MTRTLPAVLAVLLAVFALPAAASAGTYNITACNNAPGAVNNSWVYSTTDTAQPSHYAKHENCPYVLGGTGGKRDQEGGLSTTDELELHNGAAPGTQAGWSTTAPPGTPLTITAITYERYLGHELDPFNSWVPALRVDGTIIPTETCQDTFENGETCLIGGPPNQGGTPGTVTGLSAHELFFGITCQAPQGQECVTAATEHSVWAAMYGTTITFNDPTPPTLATPTGSLWEPGTANGYHHGTENVTTTAQDTGGGIQNITLTTDGQTLATYTAPCDYTYNQPCPLTTTPQTLTLQTSQLPDGTHNLTLTATDAAGNHTSTTTQITTDNDPPTAPTDLTANPIQPGNTTFIATWTNPTSQVAPITSATYQLCQPDNPSSCTQPATAPPNGPAAITIPNAGTWTLAVWLTDAAGNSSPTNAAYLTLTSPQAPSASTQAPSPGPGQTPSPTPNSLGRSKQLPLHIAAALHGRKLVVHLTGPTAGNVHISLIEQVRQQRIMSLTRTVPLRSGRLTTTFTLSARTVAHAIIQIYATLGHHSTSTTKIVPSPTRLRKGSPYGTDAVALRP